MILTLTISILSALVMACIFRSNAERECAAMEARFNSLDAIREAMGGTTFNNLAGSDHVRDSSRTQIAPSSEGIPANLISVQPIPALSKGSPSAPSRDLVSAGNSDL